MTYAKSEKVTAPRVLTSKARKALDTLPNLSIMR